MSAGFPDRGQRRELACEEARRLRQELGERRKELRAVHRLSELAAERWGSLDEVFAGVLALIPPSWQWPEITAARILFAGRELRGEGFREDGPAQASDIAAEDAVEGRIEVVLTAPPPAGEAPFLAEEQALLDTIAERLGSLARKVRREERLRRSEERFRLAVDQFPSSFVIYDAERRIRFVNSRAVEVSGRSEEELLGRRDEELHPPEVARGFLPHLVHALETRRPQGGECHFELPTGSYDVLVSYVPVLDEEGEIVQVLGTTWDVTERKRQEAERRALEARMLETQKLESLGLLAGSVAHDFNNLLTVILGNLEVARAALAEDASVQEDLEQVERAAEQAAGLTGQMLVYAGHEPMRRERLRPNDLIRETAGLLRNAVPKTMTLELDLGEDVPPVSGDPTQLRQVLINLVINAADAIGEEPGTIRVETGVASVDVGELGDFHVGADLCPGEHVRLRVVDDGCGMDGDDLARVFDPFYTTKESGRGLGLAAVLGVVRGHGGGLAVESERGEGTVFSILLPSASAEDEREVEPALPRRAAAEPGRARVLVVDDEPGIRRIAERALEQAGFLVESEPDGRRAVERLRGEPTAFDVVLLDLAMPALGGADVWSEIQRIRETLPVVFMSGFADRAEDFRPFLPKPFRPGELVEAVAAAIGESARGG